MLQTADDNADWDPKNWRVVNESGEVVHSVEDEAHPKDPSAFSTRQKFFLKKPPLLHKL